jgi:excisionase family DNA binding protein
MAQSSVTPIPDDRTSRDTLTLYDLAERMGVSYSTVYEAARRDALPVPVFRVGRRYLVSRCAYDAVMSTRHQPDTSQST